MHFKNIHEIEEALKKGVAISLNSLTTVDACVVFSADTLYGYREVQGFATEVERDISDIHEAAAYIWRERKRIVRGE